MSDFKKYRYEYDRSEMFYRQQISDRESKAYEYGLIVVKNAMLVSGGGLLAVPTIVGLSSSLDVDVSMASLAAVYFALSLLSILIASYVIHLNWMFHSEFWILQWAQRQEFLEKCYLEDLSDDELMKLGAKIPTWKITVTFFVPHVLALFFLTFSALGFVYLYSSLGVKW